MRWTVLSLFSVAAVLSGCPTVVRHFENGDTGGSSSSGASSSTGASSNTGGIGGIGGASASSGGQAGSSTSSVSSSSGGDCMGMPPDCSACGDNLSCQNCCGNAHPQSYDAFIGHFLTECGCKNPMLPCFNACSVDGGTCQSTADLTQGCIDCLNMASASGNNCLQVAGTDCATDVACSPWLQCFSSCPP